MDLLRAVAFLLAAASALAAVLCLGGAVSDRLDAFTHAAPLWLGLGVGALALQAIAGWQGGRASAALAAFGVIVFLALMGPDVIARLRAPKGPAPAGSLKLIQFNVWDRNRSPAASADWLLDQDADVVVVQEANDRGALIVRDLAGRYPYRTQCGATPDCGTLILSKAPQRDGGVLTWPGLLGRHAGAWATFGEGSGAFTVASTHYQWPIPAGALQLQARNFAARLERFDHASLIVAGDFNATPWSFTLRRQDARLGLERRTHALPTWPAGEITHWGLNFPFAFLPVDHVYAGKAWRTVSVARGPVLGSDHLPVIMVLARR